MREVIGMRVGLRVRTQELGQVDTAHDCNFFSAGRRFHKNADRVEHLLMADSVVFILENTSQAR